MTEKELAPKIEQFIEENFIFDPDTDLDRDESLLENGIIDSTGILELVSFLEKDIGIKVNDEDLIPDNLDSINKIAGFARSRLSV